jgi:hypothetical protein
MAFFPELSYVSPELCSLDGPNLSFASIDRDWDGPVFREMFPRYQFTEKPSSEMERGFL